MASPPTGTVTFLFTDIEGSTRLLQELGSGYRAVQDRHAEIMRAASHRGHEVRTEGDSFFVTFRTPLHAVEAVVTAQRAFAAEEWPQGAPLRVRMGLHTGEGVLGGGDYLGIDVNRAARIAAAGQGGQVLLSDATRSLVEHALPEGVSIRDLGRHRLKDIAHAEHLHDLVIDGLIADFPPLASLEVRPTNLPPQRTSFVGRDRELAEITKLLETARLLTLTGPGGTGKTRLAIEVAAGLLDRFADGVFFADLSAITDPALVPSEIAAVLVVRETSGRELPSVLAEHLRDRAVLLVLDNVEHLIEAAPMAARLLDAAPRLRVMATSRIPLHLSGEQEYHVRPLALPEADQVEDLARLNSCESVMLFAERAAAVLPGFRITEQTAPAVAEIVARLDGLPLALELAASRVKLLSPGALAGRLEQRLPLLTGGARDLPQRQRTLRGAIEWSHDLLGAKEQQLFARLAVFAGGWELDAAEAVCGPGLDLDVFDGLTSLVDSSLVRRRDSPDGDVRFRMLETIREFASGRLVASGEEEDVRRRHAEFVRDLAEEAEPHLTGERQAQWMLRLELEHDNIRAALDWAEHTGQLETALRTASAVWRFWQQRGHLTEGRVRLERLAGLPEARTRDATRARALSALGGTAYWQGDYEPMAAAYEEAVGIARDIGEPRLLSRALFDLSFVPLVTTVDFDRTEELLRESLAVADESDLFLRAQIWTGLGYMNAFRGDPSGAVEPLERAIAIHRNLGNRLLVAENLVGLAGVRFLLGDLTSAREYLWKALDTTNEVGSPVMRATMLVLFAFLANRRGDHRLGARLLGTSARMREDLGGGTPPMIAIRSLFGDPEEARSALGEEEFKQAWMEGRSMSMEEVLRSVPKEDNLGPRS
jgi:predicted ATPase/class 3 adenylate cyclase